MSEAPSGQNIEGETPSAEPVVETDEATVTENAELEPATKLVRSSTPEMVGFSVGLEGVPELSSV